MTTLANASNQARVLLNAFKGLKDLEAIIDAAAKAEQLEREAKERLASLVIAEAEAKGQIASANRLYDDTIARVKGESAKIVADSAALLSEAKKKAEATLSDAAIAADSQIAYADDLVAKRTAEADRILDIASAKTAELKSLDDRILEARATLRKFTEV